MLRSTLAIIALAGLVAAQTTTTEAPTFENKVVALTFDLDFGTTTDEEKTALVDDVNAFLSALFGTNDIVTTLSEGSIIATSVVTNPTVEEPEVTAITLSSGVVSSGVAVTSADDSGDRLDEEHNGGSSKLGSGDRMGGPKGKGPKGKGSKGKGSKGKSSTLLATAASTISRGSIAAVSSGLVLVAGVGLIAARHARRTGGFELIGESMEYTEPSIDQSTPLLDVSSQL